MPNGREMTEALRLYSLGEDAETASKKAGVPLEKFKRYIQSFGTAATRDHLDRDFALELLFGRCGNCKGQMARDDKFCLNCGQVNPQFDESLFTQINGSTYADYLVDSDQGLHHELKIEGYHYCCVCGKNLAIE